MYIAWEVRMNYLLLRLNGSTSALIFHVIHEVKNVAFQEFNRRRV